MLKAKQRADWAIPDPKHLSPKEFRLVRNPIRSKVENVLKSLGIAVCDGEQQPSLANGMPAIGNSVKQSVGLVGNERIL